jgi:hypothetical protein
VVLKDKKNTEKTSTKHRKNFYHTIEAKEGPEEEALFPS